MSRICQERLQLNNDKFQLKKDKGLKSLQRSHTMQTANKPVKRLNITNRERRANQNPRGMLPHTPQLLGRPLSREEKVSRLGEDVEKSQPLYIVIASM